MIATTVTDPGPVLGPPSSPRLPLLRPPAHRVGAGGGARTRPHLARAGGIRSASRPGAPRARPVYPAVQGAPQAPLHEPPTQCGPGRGSLMDTPPTPARLGARPPGCTPRPGGQSRPARERGRRGAPCRPRTPRARSRRARGRRAPAPGAGPGGEAEITRAPPVLGRQAPGRGRGGSRSLSVSLRRGAGLYATVTPGPRISAPPGARRASRLAPPPAAAALAGPGHADCLPA